jgi:hypothetical protein
MEEIQYMDSNSSNKKWKRPKFVPPIDWSMVDKLLKSGCTGSEIAGYFGISKNTMYLRAKEEHGINFSEYSQMQRKGGNAILRNKQFDVAMDGDRGMLIWLGRQRLGQRDNPAIVEEMPQMLVDFIETMKVSFGGKAACIENKEAEDTDEDTE